MVFSSSTPGGEAHVTLTRSVLRGTRDCINDPRALLSVNAGVLVIMSRASTVILPLILDTKIKK